MPENGKHHRFRTSSLTRGIIAVTTGGAALALPVIGATSAFAAPAPTAAVEKAATSTAASGKGIAAQKSESTSYSVILGDTLAKIAREHSVNGGWKALYEDNQKAVGGNPDLIHPGLKLTIGAKADSKPEKAESKASTTSDRAEKGADRADRSERTNTSLAAEGAPAAEAAPAAESVSYTNDLDGWIKESLAVMAEHGIPGTYEGIHRNIIRESAGDPQAINNWDINAINGVPSKGLLQVIDPTFQAYHVPGTSMDSYDPVANITAACNYAADKYGSIDNVFGAY
ncbi:LysM peptidoglycan-binding domain-containing protein [Streptomyces sp. NPDC049952]|uniref:Lytic transglycosylase catalytic n=1 Tax=Streptomyces pratensis (strain ATCC 33331 / IAF-45CD) TaxID=591167 RepID=A0A8D3WHV7_STRFA|nr:MULTISPECIES: LysM peptidoglycan-binding domain-containing protein [unclassified Streptomyces]MDF9869532.1 LysM repeat protein [Streptomyces pratensis]MCY1654211.1 LysM peptidoglycan-binding domain-containing protein [Streptomyces sp. SL203]MCY1678511.1 LysM peptidoglycan-binding domain-containing protein [Streptomyces sp. SL294]MDX3184991.1 LysM peptidoglycan-binding domain-containing protein [Streptomyces sp. ME02-7008A-1]MDX3305483.1 LysM peptidoglycan-binding domain-containing protein [